MLSDWDHDKPLFLYGDTAGQKISNRRLSLIIDIDDQYKTGEGSHAWGKQVRYRQLASQESFGILKGYQLP